jgi:hypothetical protein
MVGVWKLTMEMDARVEGQLVVDRHSHLGPLIELESWTRKLAVDEDHVAREAIG